MFGSLSRREWFRDFSDIDLAAWEISPDKFYRALAAVTEMTAEFDVDLVDGGTAPRSLLRAIRTEGVDV